MHIPGNKTILSFQLQFYPELSSGCDKSDSKNKFWEELTAYFPFIQTDRTETKGPTIMCVYLLQW
jgi:hypothetical protein